MITSILTSPLFVPVIQAVLSTVITAVFGWVAVHAVAWFSAHKKVAALGVVAEHFADALKVAAQAASADIGKPGPVVAAAAWAAAEKSVLASWPDIENALGVELSVVLGQKATAAAGESVSAPGGGVVVLPTPLAADGNPEMTPTAPGGKPGAK